MRNAHPGPASGPHAWQNPDFLSNLNRSLLPQATRPQPKKKKVEERERFFKLVTRRVAR